MPQWAKKRVPIKPVTSSFCLFLLLFLAASEFSFSIDTYIVAGQSNGWRISHLKQATDDAPVDTSRPKVHYFGMECVSEPDSSTLVTLTSLNENTMGYGLAQALADRAGEDIVFIQYCRCGASVLKQAVDGWWPGEDPANGETFDNGLFGLFRRYIESARTQVKAELGEELEFKGLFWHQGESDAGRDKAKFEKAVTNLFWRFRNELGADLPIVVGHIRDRGEGPRAVNAALDRIAAEDENVITVPVVGLEFGADRDNGKQDVHLARPGCHELGYRMVKAHSALELQSGVQ